jgi:hypothetical protein
LRRVLVLAGVAIAALVSPSLALAHPASPNMTSIVTGVTPKTPGLSLSVLNGDDRFQLIYHGDKPIIIYGYNGDQYARFLPGGTVQVNHNSPAFYLDTDRAGTATVPAGIKSTSPPDWHTVDKTGRFEWHDHRMHWMGTGVPPQVKNTKVRQEIYPYKVPISIGGTKGNILGTLWWTPRKQSGPPIGAFVAFALVLLASIALVIWVRRRRNGGGPDAPAPTTPDDRTGEDAAPPQRPTVEAW